MMLSESDLVAPQAPIADHGLDAVIAMARQVLDQLNEILKISAPLLNALVALGKTLRDQTGEMAPIRRSPKIAALSMPYLDPFPVTGTPSPPGHRLGATSQPRRNNASATPATRLDVPEVEITMVSMNRQRTTAPEINAGRMWTGEMSRNVALQTVQVSPTSEAGLPASQPGSADHAIISELATSEHSTRPASPNQLPDQASRGRQKPSAPGIDFAEVEPRWVSLVRFPETTRTDDDAIEEDSHEQETDQAGSNIAGRAPTFQNARVNRNHAMKLGRSVPQRNPSSVHGTIYIDGVSLGHWVIDHFANEATRPNTGTTGFDPRITAVYPGAPIGG